MSEVKNILLVGVGGQGTILASKILTSGLMKAGYDVKMSEIHGMSQRGGSVSTQVRFGDKVYSPIVGRGSADVIVAFEEMEALRWLDHLKIGGTMVINEGALYASQIRMQELSFLTTQYQPVFPSSQNLTPGQVEAIRTILVSRSENRYDNLEALSQKVQKLVGPKPWAMAHEAYLTTVWRDYQAYH